VKGALSDEGVYGEVDLLELSPVVVLIFMYRPLRSLLFSCLSSSISSSVSLASLTPRRADRIRSRHQDEGLLHQ
jgi:hypothetical protein